MLGRVSCPTAHHTVRVPVIGISTAGVESKCAPDMVTVRDNRTSTPTCSVLSSSAFVSIPSAHLQAVRVQEPRSDSVDKIGSLTAAGAHNCICCGLPACGIAHSVSPTNPYVQRRQHQPQQRRRRALNSERRSAAATISPEVHHTACDVSLCIPQAAVWTAFVVVQQLREPCWPSS